MFACLTFALLIFVINLIAGLEMLLKHRSHAGWIALGVAAFFLFIAVKIVA